MADRFEEKAQALVDKMTIEEACSQLRYDAPAVERLGIPAYNWWNEALHGVARAGVATVFPQAIGLAATFDERLAFKEAEVISTEARAKYNMQSAQGDRDIYKGLTMWSPNVNIFRDGRWGRGQETYGEDPYLTSRLGLAFTKGLQGDKEHLKVAACAKHFAVHSGPEALRHSFDAVVTDKDLYETYLPAFRTLVEDGNVETVMGAYNRTNGEPCCASERLLCDILRDEWNFKGHVVSDCWALMDIHKHHCVTESVEESAALAISNGCDLNCGCAYQAILNAYEMGIVTEEQIRTAAKRLMTTRFRLGILGDETSEYDGIDFLENDTKEHHELSLDISRKSAVLLKNDGTLPLDRDKISTIAVIGPNADSTAVLEGNYAGTMSCHVTNLEGIRALAGENIRVLYSQGCALRGNKVEGLAQDEDRISEAIACAKCSDIAIVCLGLDASIEGEQGDEGNIYAAGDRETLFLPPQQKRLLDAVLLTGTPTICVLNIGSPVDLDGRDNKCAAVLHCWYSGMFGGKALGEILFGAVSPSGKLPLTFQKNETLPDFVDYSMRGRTYRYVNSKDVIYPFGYGLTYGKIVCSNLSVQNNDDDGVKISLVLENKSKTETDDVVEVYIQGNYKEYSELNPKYAGLFDADNQPKFKLCKAKRVHLRADEGASLELKIDRKSFETVLECGESVILSGRYKIFVGTSQPDRRSAELMGATPVEAEVEIKA